MSVTGTLPLWSGNDALITLTTTDQDSPTPAAKNLTGASEIIFAIAKAQGKVAFLSKSLTADPTKVIVTDAPNGIFTVELTKADTEPLKTSHTWYEVRVTDSAGKTATVASGTVIVQENTITT